MPSGLRELKKQITRESIAGAAVRLALEKGLDHVTVEEIARVAFVSPRTVANYFSCKEEAVVAAGAEDVRAIVEELARRPITEPPMQSLRLLLVDFARSRTEDQLRISAQTMELAQQYGSLLPFQTAHYDKLEDSLRDAIAQRTGADIDEHMYPWLVAGAAVSAYKSAMRLWSRTGATAEMLPRLIQTAFEQISDASQSHASSATPGPTDVSSERR
jgi:AcrR family transcriptional regulator